MCGIWAVFGFGSIKECGIENSLKIKHRGPDFTRMESIPYYQQCHLVFHRLSIIDSSKESFSEQPMRLRRYPHVRMIYNGEIYNYKQLFQKYDFPSEFGNDGEIIIHLYMKFGMKKTLQLLDGVYAIVLFDSKLNQVSIGRDTFGVRPLFTVESPLGQLGISSEAKSLVYLTKDKDLQIIPYIPGHYSTYSVNCANGLTNLLICERFTDVDIKQEFDINVTLNESIQDNIHNLLEDAVKKRLMSERKIGCLLSGGLDSSLITALVVKLSKEANYKHQIETFAVGLKISPDMKYARTVAQKLQTNHHEVVYTTEELSKYMDDVMYTMETYDILTLRGSFVLYLLIKYIKENSDTIVLFAGEGADELAQGYMLFKTKENADESLQLAKSLLRELYLFDCVRPDRVVCAFGLELRLPFLDKAFSSYYLSLPKELQTPQNGIEKYLLRESFIGKLEDFLPNEVLWRGKNGLSQGSSTTETSLENTLKHIAKSRITDNELSNAAHTYPVNTPADHEQYLYRKTFESNFPCQSHLTPYMWNGGVVSSTYGIHSKLFRESHLDYINK